MSAPIVDLYDLALIIRRHKGTVFDRQFVVLSGLKANVTQRIRRLR